MWKMRKKKDQKRKSLFNMLEDLKKLKDTVRNLLLRYPKLRSPYQRKQAHLYFWKETGEIGDFLFNSLMKIYPYLTSAETISRAIRKLQEEEPSLRPEGKLEQERLELAEKYRVNFKKKGRFDN